MFKQVAITLSDGTTQYIDPIEKIEIDNGFATYSYGGNQIINITIGEVNEQQKPQK